MDSNGDKVLIETAKSECASIKRSLWTLFRTQSLAGLNKDEVAKTLHNSAARLTQLAQTFEEQVYFVSQQMGKRINVVFWTSTAETNLLEQWIGLFEGRLGVPERGVLAGSKVPISVLMKMRDKTEFRDKHSKILDIYSEIDWYGDTELIRVNLDPDQPAIINRYEKAKDITNVFQRPF